MKMLAIFFLVCLLNTDRTIRENAPKMSIAFRVNNGGFDVEGTLGVTKAEIKFDEGNLPGSYIWAQADPSSIQTGISIRDKHLKRIDYFDVNTYPEIKVCSKSFKKIGKHEFMGLFDLTIKSITKEIPVRFTIRKSKTHNYYESNFEINRLDFQLGEESIILDEGVKISVFIQASKQTKLK
jgi:polyisoprenoid-binding protein YceI